MSSSDYPQGGVCEKCGMRTSIDDEGKTACDGCGKPTEHCQCEAAKV
jgi:predicted amidophosphoribosyltransferase